MVRDAASDAEGDDAGVEAGDSSPVQDAGVTGEGDAAEDAARDREPEDAPVDGDGDGDGVPGEDYPVLLFDGVCNLCTGSVRFVIERDPAGLFRFAPLQSDVADDVLAGHRVDPGDLDTVVLVEDGTAYTKSTAALRVARRLSGPWPLLWSLRFVPRVVRDAVYDLVAAVRYDVFGQKDRCMVPTPDVRERFLETSG